MKRRTLAVVIAVVGAAAASGCSSASQLPAASGEPAGYWTQSRLLGATPWREIASIFHKSANGQQTSGQKIETRQ